MKKKLLSTILCAGLLSINLAYGADDLPQVKVSCKNIPLTSPLQNIYSGYTLEYINESQNPIRVNDVKCYNKINTANIVTNTKMKKSTIACLCLAPLTLGFSSLFALPELNKRSVGVLDAQNEAIKFNAYAGTGELKTYNEVLAQGQSMRFNVLVPINQIPEATGSFEDITTHKYIRVEGTK